MSWWRSLFADRGLRPQTTTPTRSASVDDGVVVWLRAAFETASWDELAERDAVERLRARGAEAVEAIAHAYWTYPDDHALRWAMVRCAAAVGGPEATAFLADVLTSEIGPERSRDVHHYSSVAEESTQRMQAARGLATPAAEGDERALDALSRALEHPVTVVRHAALVVVRDLPEEARAPLAPGFERARRELGHLGVADVADHPLPREPFSHGQHRMPPSADGLGLDRPSTRRAPRLGRPDDHPHEGGGESRG